MKKGEKTNAWYYHNFFAYRKKFSKEGSAQDNFNNHTIFPTDHARTNCDASDKMLGKFFPGVVHRLRYELDRVLCLMEFHRAALGETWKKRKFKHQPLFASE